MKKLLLCILSLASINFILAQGFQNKRFSASYELGPSFLGRHFIYDRIILLRNSLEIYYALNKRFTVGVGLNFIRRDIDTATIASMALTSKAFGFNPNTLNHTFSTSTIVSDFTLSIGFRYFAQKYGSLAPLGRYFGLSFEQGFQNAFYEYVDADGETRMKYDSGNRVPLSLVSATFGRNIILNQKFMLGYGMIMGYNITRENQFRRYTARPFINLGILF
jgi:long-subunit fatty acid transport protein